MKCPRPERASSGREQLLEHALHLPRGFAESTGAVASEPERAVPLDQRPQLARQRFARARIELGNGLIQADAEARLADPASCFQEVARPDELGLRTARFVVLRS